MRRTFFIFYSLLIANICFAQSASSPVVYPRMTPPSPEASSLGRYGEFPVSLCTGTPDISIPIYDIKSGKLELPISINYHASGIRVNDISSRIGLGWSLMAGGVISRAVKGLPDDDGGIGYYITGLPPEAENDATSLCFISNLVLQGNRDTEPDDFFYSFGAENGKFLFTNKQITPGGQSIAVPIPYDLIKINWVAYNKFTITDVDGSLYVYGNSLTGQPAVETTYAMSSAGVAYYGAPYFITSWYLTEVVSADKSDTIKLKYTNPYLVHGETHVSTSLKDDISDPATANPDFVTTNYDYSKNDVYEIRLSEINFRNGKVTFEYGNSTRLDVNADTSLVGITVYQYYHNTYNQIKRFVLNQSYFTCNNISPQNPLYSNIYPDLSQGSKRLRLDSLQEVDANGIALPAYSFAYSPFNLPYVGSCAQDYWGFYNGATNNSNLLIYGSDGNIYHAPSIAYGANRKTNPDSIGAAMLSRITFPTGGYTTFRYECNKLSSTYVGGLRIKTIVSYDGYGNGITKTYNYFNEVPISNLYTGNIETIGADLIYPLISVEPFSSTNATTVHRTYKTYRENFNWPLGASDGAAVCYGLVEELSDSSNGINGKKVYTFMTNQDQSPSIGPQCTSTYEWSRGLELTEKTYKSISPGNFLLLRSKQNIFTYNDRPNLPVKRLAARATYLDQYSGGGILVIAGCPPWSANNSFLAVYNSVPVGNQYLTQQIDTVFDQNGLNPKIDVTNYYYDDTLNTRPVRIETTDSKGNLIKTINRTPLEKSAINASLALSSSASLAVDSMIAKNIINPVLDQEKYVGATLTSKTRTNYKVFNSKLVAPSDMQLQVRNNPIETRIQYNRYDNFGNIISGSKTNDALNTYIWDYQNSFIIAAVSNADSTEAAYTSFESNGTGGWSFTDTSRNRLYAITGDQSYNIVTGKTITRTVPSGKAYIVSYWCRNGAITVSANGVSIAPSLTGLAKNGWTYYQHLLPNTTTSVSLSATNAIIDEIRLYPRFAQMTTYTYNPLVGSSSMCGPDNSIVYYEYDNFKRLKLIRDVDKNIVKVFDYEYQVSPHTFKSTVQSGVFYRNNCTSCQMGGSYTYTVNDNAYSSVISQFDADQKAMNDVTTNGQIYANIYGSCTTPTTAPLTGSNSTIKSFSLAFHNNCTGANYNYTLNVTGGTSVGPIPVGNYNITINPVGGLGAYTYRIDGFTQHTTNASFYSIDLLRTSNILIITN